MLYRLLYGSIGYNAVECYFTFYLKTYNNYVRWYIHTPDSMQVIYISTIGKMLCYSSK